MQINLTEEEILKAWMTQKPVGRQCGKTLWLAIAQALQKQYDAQKPVEKEIVYGIRYDTFCPACGHDVAIYENFCSECGQKLDWKGMK